LKDNTNRVAVTSEVLRSVVHSNGDRECENCGNIVSLQRPGAVVTNSDDIKKIVEGGDEPPKMSIQNTCASSRANEHLRLAPASAVRPERVTWGWQDRIPVGMVSLLVGQGGLGKSLEQHPHRSSKYGDGGGKSSALCRIFLGGHSLRLRHAERTPRDAQGGVSPDPAVRNNNDRLPMLQSRVLLRP